MVDVKNTLETLTSALAEFDNVKKENETLKQKIDIIEKENETLKEKINTLNKKINAAKSLLNDSTSINIDVCNSLEAKPFDDFI